MSKETTGGIAVNRLRLAALSDEIRTSCDAIREDVDGELGKKLNEICILCRSLIMTSEKAEEEARRAIIMGHGLPYEMR